MGGDSDVGITCCMQDQHVVFEQTARHPMVYLDNWTMNLCLQNPSFGENLCSQISALRGTLMLSTISILEITGRCDMDWMKKIAGFVDRMDGAFIDTNPLIVIEREKELVRGGVPFEVAKPWSDRRLLEAYVLHAHDYLKTFRLSEVIIQFKMALNEGRVIQDEFELTIFPSSLRVRNDETALERAKARYANRRQGIKSSGPHTEDLCRMAIDFVAINEHMQMPDKEWRDFFQAIVPVAYCDFVFMDRRWVHFIETSSLKPPNIAKVYSSREIGVVLQDLANCR